MATLLDLIKHYQHSIEKYPEDEQKILKAIDKLFNLDVKVQHLQETGVGRTVNALRKEPGMVGKAARALVYKWKLMVASEESDQEGDYNDSSTQNGNEKNPDDDQNSKSTAQKDYGQMNGNHSGSKRKYHSSEEEEPDTKKSRHSHSSESEDYKKKHIHPKAEPETDSHSSDSHSESDTESESSGEERKPVKIKTEPEDKPSNSKHSSREDSNNLKSESSSSKRSQEISEHNGSKHSKHSSESRQSSDKVSRSKESSREKEQNSDKKHSSEKRHRSDKEKSKDKPESKDKAVSKDKADFKNKESKDKLESKSSSKSSSERTNSSSHKTESSSDKHKEQGKNKFDKYSSSKSDKEKHKSSLEKEEKQKFKEGSSSKESSSSKERSSSSKEKTKDRSSSSKEKSKSSSSNHSKSEKKQSSSNEKSDKSKSDSRNKSDKSEETNSEKKSSHKSSSSLKSNSSSSKSKEGTPKKNVTISTDSDEDGIGCESGASFAEALGMVLPAKTKKKQSTTPIKDAFSPISTGIDLSPPSLLAPHAQLAPLPALEISALPEISPHYKPRPPPKFIPHFTEEDLGAAITSKNQRTKVYSGNKIMGKIPSLYDMCVQILQEHIDALEYTGGVPYEILKPVVDKATPQQLFMLEHYNPYLMEDTDHLWKKHCEKNFRNKKRQEMETWREMYMRCQEEQESKLKSLTANIRLTQEAKKAPIKQTKMAYVDSVVKPPRNVARKQAQHGTAHAATASPAARVASLASQPNVLRGGLRAPPAPPTSLSSLHKPKKAPLMAKALQLMRGRKR